jgi:hypothetical protein
MLPTNPHSLGQALAGVPLRTVVCFVKHSNHTWFYALHLTDTQFQALQGHFEARLEAETKTLSSRIDGAATSTTVTVAIVVAAFQTVAVAILVITRRKSSATASCVDCNEVFFDI